MLIPSQNLHLIVLYIVIYILIVDPPKSMIIFMQAKPLELSLRLNHHFELS